MKVPELGGFRGELPTSWRRVRPCARLVRTEARACEAGTLFSVVDEEAT